ncbi:hypothetical protein AB0G74_27370 [Streptomyces sp. NPDC020875]|uniref:hypothetical protein n=1 Tax=Streptomyces sp. NPDC020875 TaxID=3154898 RepID=UPI0033F3E0FD
MTGAKDPSVEQQIASLRTLLEQQIAKKADKAATEFLTVDQVRKEALKDGDPLATEKWVKAQAGEPAGGGGGGGGTQIGPFNISPEMVKAQPDVFLLALGLVLVKMDLAIFDLSEKVNNIVRRPIYGAGNRVRRWLHGVPDPDPAPAPESGADPAPQPRRRFYQLRQAQAGSMRARIGLSPDDEERAWRTPMDQAQREMDLLGRRIAALEGDRPGAPRNTPGAGGGGNRSGDGQGTTGQQRRAPGNAGTTARPGAGGQPVAAPNLRPLTQDVNNLTQAVDGR